MAPRSWAGGLSGFTGGISKGYDLITRMQDRERALNAERMFGSTLRDMYGPTPQPVPGSTPMHGSPFSMPTQPMPAALPPRSMTGTPQPAPGQFPGQMRGGAPPTEMTWQKVMSAAARQLGTQDPIALAGVVDRMLPLMNAQSQAEWREMSARIRMLENQRKTSADERRFEQGDRRLALAEKNADALANYRATTIAQRDQEIAQKAAKDPAIQRSYDATKQAYAQAENNYRAALKGVSDAEYNMSEDAKTRAYAELEQAEKARDQAWTRLETFAKTPAPTTGGPPATRPLRDALKTGGVTKPAATAAAPPGAVETTPEGEQMVRTKTGARAQVGTVKPQATGVAPPAPAAATGGTRPSATVTAEPTGSMPAAQVFPMPKSKAMAVKGRRYNVPNRGVYTWDGEKFVLVKGNGRAQ